MEVIRRIHDLLECWEQEVARYEKRALPENASSLEDQVECRRDAARLRLRISELRKAMGL